MTINQIFQAYFQYQRILRITEKIDTRTTAEFTNATSHDHTGLFTLENFSNPARFLFLNGEIESVNYPSTRQDILSETSNAGETSYKEFFSGNSKERIFAALRNDKDASWKFIGFEIEHCEGLIFLNFIRNNPGILAQGNCDDKAWVKQNYVSAMLMIDSFQALVEFDEHRAYILEHLYMNESDNWAITLTEIIDQQKTCRYQTIAGSMSWKITTYAPAD